jgi:outer membrane protein assembly factor BamD
MTVIRQLFIIFALSMLLAACSSKGKKDPYQDWPADEIYAEATDALLKKKFKKAVAAYESLSYQYPFGEYTEDANLNLIYAYYRHYELPAAMRSAERFAQSYPRSENLDYAYYMQGLIKSTESISFVARLVPLDLTQRDSENEKEAFAHFETFLDRFPDSPYAPDARQRMIAIRNDLATHQLIIAKYYMTRGAWLAAANRAQNVVQHYPQTPAVAESLAVMTVAYDKLDLKEMSAQTQEVLVLNEGEDKAEELLQAVRKAT